MTLPIQRNLDLIASSPDDQNFGLEEDGKTLKKADSTDDKTRAVIERTLKQAVRAETTKDRIWVKMEGDEEYSLGHLLHCRKSLRLVDVELEDTKRELATVSHKGEEYKVDLHRLKCFSPVIIDLLQVFEDVKCIPLMIEIDPEYVKAALNVINGEELGDTLSFKDLIGVLTVANHLDSDDLREVCARAISELDLGDDKNSTANMEIMKPLPEVIIVPALKYCSSWKIKEYLDETIEKDDDGVVRSFHPLAALFVNIGSLKIQSFDSIEEFASFVDLAQVKLLDLQSWGHNPTEILQKCPQLEILYCSRLWKGEKLDFLQHVPRLKELYLIRCECNTRDNLQFLEYVPDLEILDVSNTRFLLDSGFDFLKHLKNLKQFFMRSCNTLRKWDELSHCSLLEVLDFALDKSARPDRLEILKKLPNLSYLNISGCTRLAPDSLKWLECASNLQTLKMEKCTQLDTASYQHLLDRIEVFA